jgi:frataxin-like iron-binding protein CyaY
MMDPKDFRITVRETFDRIGDALRRHAVEGVEAVSGDTCLTLQFDSLHEIVLRSDDDAQRLALTSDTTSACLYYHEIEERWFEERTEEPLGALLNRHLTAPTGRAAAIPPDVLP